MFRIPFRARTPTLVAALLSLHPWRLSAQQPITLQEAIALARQRGLLAQAATAMRAAARYRYQAFRARLLPQLAFGSVGSTAATYSYNRAIIPVVQPDGSTLFRPQDQTNAAAGLMLTQKLPLTGGDLFVSSSLARVTISSPQWIQTWSSTPLAIGLQQDILRPNVVAWDRREQSVRAERDERTYLEAMEDIALQTTAQFFDLYAARVAFENATKNVAVNDTLYRLNTGRLEVGKIGENDLLQSELALLRARSALEAARLDYDRATAALRIALNVPPDTPLEIAASTTVPEFAIDTGRAVAEALRHRAAVSDVELQNLLADRALGEAKLRRGIGATVSASVGFNATAPEANLVYQNLLQSRQFAMYLQVPLWQWGAHGAEVEAAEATREAVASQSRERIAQVVHEARYAARGLVQARRTVALLAKADTVAAKRFAVAYNRYVIGRITMDNLYIGQTEKDQAVTQFVQGLRDYWLAYYGLRKTTLFDFATEHEIR
jgi:outer membrane protein